MAFYKPLLHADPRPNPNNELARIIGSDGKPKHKNILVGNNNRQFEKSLEDEYKKSQLQQEKEATTFGVKYTQEDIAFSLFGKGGRAFRVGWKFGKRIYAIEKKCKKIENFEEKLGCQVSNQTGDPIPTFCVVKLAEGDLKIDECMETMEVKLQTPCTYFNGTVIGPNSTTIMSNAYENILELCSSH